MIAVAPPFQRGDVDAAKPNRFSVRVENFGPLSVQLHRRELGIKWPRLTDFQSVLVKRARSSRTTRREQHHSKRRRCQDNQPLHERSLTVLEISANTIQALRLSPILTTTHAATHIFAAVLSLNMVSSREDFGLRWRSAAATPLLDCGRNFQSGVAPRFLPQSKTF
jgi:hypothetical protein